MAPWPAQGNEPKAPDKNKTSDSRTVDNLKSKSEPPEDKKINKGISKDDQNESKKRDVHSLDDGQLKALLDEAIQYKNPKDREGKSKIFRELLQKAEADDSDISYPVIGIKGSGGRRALRGREGGKSITISERASRGGSLQNIFHASSSAEFDTHHCGGARKKNKRQGPGSSVSARQREGGSLPSNVNAGWPLESWQSDQIKKKGLFDRDSQQANHVYTTFGNTAYCNSSSVATTTQARRQTLKHSASNELPSTKKQSPGELYPLRRHHSSSDQLRSFELSIVKLKNQSESTSMVRKVPQVSKPSDCVSFDVGSLNLEMKKLSDSDPSLGLEKKLQNFQNSEKFRITSCEMESENSNNITSQGVYTTSFTASLEVEPVDSPIELGFGDKKGSSAMGSVQLSDNYPSVQCIVGERTSISDSSNQGRFGEQQFAYRPHMYRNLNMNMIVNISSKTANDSPRTDENGNALNMQSLTTRGSNPKKNYKRKLLAEKNVVFSQNIAGYRGDNDIETLLNFIESDKAKNKQLKKSLTKGKKQEKKRQNMQKSTSLEEVSQRNIEDLTESSESERASVRKPRTGNNADTALRDRRRWGEQGFLKIGSQNDLNIDQREENNSDSEFQTVTKKQRKRKVNEANPKRGRNHRNSRRSPRRKSTSSVPPSERSADSDLDSVHSLPVGGAPTVSYADIAAGNAGFFSPKVISELNSYNNNSNNNNNNNNGNTEKIDSVSAVKTNEIEKWCDSVSQHWEKTKVNNNNKNIYVNNKNNNYNNSNSGNNNSGFYKNNSINANNNIHNNNNLNVSHTYINSNSDLKNCSRHGNKKQNLENVENVVNEICDNVKKLKDLIVVDKSVESDVTSNKDVEISLKNDFKKVTSNCDLEQCKIVDKKTNDSKKNWSKKNFSREDFPSLPIKSEITNNYQKNKELNEQNSNAKVKPNPSLPDSEKPMEEKKCESNPIKTPRKPKSEGEVRHRRSNRSKSVGPNPRPPVILLQDERTKDTSVCEITFGFEVNEQLLTSDDSAQVFEEEGEAVDETFSSSSKSSCKSNNESFNAGANRICDSSANVELCTANGGVIYNEDIKNQDAYSNTSKTILSDVTNSALQELFKRHETMTAAKVVQSESHCQGNTSGNSIANKYVPPVTPIQFNHDKIVTFVGMAWEDVIKNGKIQYYTGDN